MNTPAHVAASLFVWRKHSLAAPTSALLTGAILPDAPMFLFYAVVKAMGSAEKEIWNRLYFQGGWQLFFDIFNSAPLFLFILAIAVWRKQLWWSLFSASALLHVACDFPLHHDDSHRHLLPLSHFRFASPISYWDPKHYGIPIAITEALLTVCASIFLLLKSDGKLVRVSSGLILMLYALVLILVAAWFLRSS